MKNTQFLLFLKSALRDFLNNRLLHGVTIITIALSLLVVCAFALFFMNVSHIAELWMEGVRIMAYTENEIPKDRVKEIKDEIAGFEAVSQVHYISRDEALEQLRSQMKRHTGLLDNLRDNPLPASFEIRLLASFRDWDKIEQLAAKIESFREIKEVEYGKEWIDRISTFFNLFRFACFAIGTLLLMTTLFVIANTIRLVLYSRREEIEIMRLVGATHWFIKIPLYLEAMLQGGIGGAIGLSALFILFFTLFSANASENLFQLNFFSLQTSITIILASMVIGCLGCYISLRQFLKI